MDRKIIMLCSPTPQCGKDTIGGILVSKYGYKRYAFADAVKEICFEQFLWDGSKNKRGRELLVGIGETVRSYNKFFWINKLALRIFKDFRDNALDTNIVITDLRMAEEVMLINRLEDFDLKFEKVVVGVRNEKAEDEYGYLLEDSSQKDYFKIELNYSIINNFQENPNGLKNLEAMVDLLVEEINHNEGDRYELSYCK